MSRKANYEAIQSITVFAAAAYSRGIMLVLNSAGRHVLPSAGDLPDVVTLAPSTFAGEAIQGGVKNGGIYLAEAGEALSVNDRLACNASGQVVVATEGDEVFGKAHTAAAAAGELVAFQFGYLGVEPA